MSRDIQALMSQYRENFRQHGVILSFNDYLQRLASNPRLLLRNSPHYLLDTFEYFGQGDNNKDRTKHFKLFDRQTPASPAIIGGREAQTAIYTTLHTFCAQGMVDKLILLHGPNGSAKTSTIETIAASMRDYSFTDEGSVYRFNWVFPQDMEKISYWRGESKPIGFGKKKDQQQGKSYAYLEDDQISCKIPSEFRENPFYLLPMPQREQLLRQWIANSENKSIDDIELPPHVLLSGLSKRNQLIMENLLNGYEGNLEEVYRHIQVERFYFSRQYRVGISTVEPQMSIDAQEKQLTMERYLANLPVILQNFRFHESFGELVEANRGFLEFSDLLKRPIDTFKYLLSTIEKSILNLHSGTIPLDVVFFATTNETHLDAFKTIPDFSSFRERFNLITVPYLLRPSEEQQIYLPEVKILEKATKVAPHTIEFLSLWAVLTRLKQPNKDAYDEKHAELIKRLGPRNKVRLYEGEKLDQSFSIDEVAVFRSLTKELLTESHGAVVFEGRIGISPREVKAVIYRAAQNRKVLTVIDIFDELERMIKERSVYEFLSISPRGRYHDVNYFLDICKKEFCYTFYRELIDAMDLVDHQAYIKLLNDYVEHVACYMKKEKILNPTTGEFNQPSEDLMVNVENILAIGEGKRLGHRQKVLNRLAAFRVENPEQKVDLEEIFVDYTEKIQGYYFFKNARQVKNNFNNILSLDNNDYHLTTEQRQLAETTLTNLQEKYGYTKEMIISQLKFVIDGQYDPLDFMFC